MLDLFRGLPVHVLIVHFTVVVGVAAVLAGLVYGLVPRVRRTLGWPLAVLGVLTLVLGLITPSSGEALEKRVPPSALLEHHTQLGGQLGTIMDVFGVVLVLAVLVARFGRTALDASSRTGAERIAALPGTTLRAFPGQAPLALLLVALTVAGSVLTGVWLFRTGEAGSRAAWADVARTQPQRGGDGG